MTPEITIGILTHNRSWHFAQCIASIREFTETPYQIGVLDTKSDIHHCEHMRQFEGDDCQFVFADVFYSCLEGRRKLLDMVDTEFIAYVDDDARVGPGWLQHLLRPMRNDPDCGAAVMNIVQEGKQATSGARFVEHGARSRTMHQHKPGYIGEAPACCGGATLYRTDVLRATEFREEFNGGYEDWDQTLQITQDLKKRIYATPATAFHYHMPENGPYCLDRWRWRPLLESAIGIWDRWQIRTAIDNTLLHFLKNNMSVPRDQMEKAMEALI